MQIPKQQIISLIESRLGSDQAQQAAQQLPDQVDHEQHADLLSQFGIDPQEAAQQTGPAAGEQ
jgi:predicted PhzF superfamily epimerase YddE/YHI9